MGCSTRKILYILLGIFIFVTIYSFLSPQNTEVSEVPLSKLVQEIQNDQVEKVVVEGQEINIDLKNGQKQVTTKEEGASFTEVLTNSGIEVGDVNIEIKDSTANQYWISFFKLNIVRSCIFKGHSKLQRFLLDLKSMQCGVLELAETPLVRIGDEGNQSRFDYPVCFSGLQALNFNFFMRDNESIPNKLLIEAGIH